METTLPIVLEKELTIEIGDGHLTMYADLHVTKYSKGIIFFVHSSGSSRFSPRNRYIAKIFNEAGYSTLLLDLLTPEEERMDAQTSALRFDIRLLTGRLAQATQWIRDNEGTKHYPIGYFGINTGTAASFLAGLEFPKDIKAIVSRQGRPDLASNILSMCKIPTLLIVGESDPWMVDINRRAFDYLGMEKELKIVPGVGNSMENLEDLHEVGRLAVEWFERFI